MSTNPFFYIASEGISFFKLSYFVSSQAFSLAAQRGCRTMAHVAIGPALPLALGTRYQSHTTSFPDSLLRGCSALGGGTQGHMTPRRKSSHWTWGRASRAKSLVWSCLDTWCGFKSGHLPCPTSQISAELTPFFLSVNHVETTEERMCFQ